MSDNKNWKIRTQEVRDIFFRMYLTQRLKISVISKYLGVSKSSLYRWVKEGVIKPINPTRTKGYRNIINDDHKQEIIDYIINNNTTTLKNIKEYIRITYNIYVSISTIHRFCINNKITLKKGSLSYTESDIDKVNLFKNSINKEEINKYFMIDEASFSLNHSRIYARSIKGSRAVVRKPGNRIKRYSLLLGINYNNKVEYEIHKGSINSIIFRNFIKKLPNESILVLDNARIHHATKSLTAVKLSTIPETVKEKNSKLKYLPPYTPQLNPVELCFNIIRTSVNNKSPRTYEELENYINSSIKNIKFNSVIDKVWNFL